MLIKEIEAVVSGTHEFEHRDMSILMALSLLLEFQLQFRKEIS